ncbi:MAG: DUF6261 family protein [Odoribacteraceae bacterium]|jgi:hypothetical protein|nr:DUF6261 family protein [Odoribacteraceae bacterium]
MKSLIVRLQVDALRNATHVEYHEDFSALLSKHGADALGVETLYNDYAGKFAREKNAFEVIRKSELTSRIKKKDRQCNELFRGLASGVDFNLYHFDDETRAAARSLKIAFDHYGNINTRTYEDRAALATDLVSELSSAANAPRIIALGLAPWVTKLSETNAEFIALVRARDAEVSRRPSTRMKEARVPVDKAYRRILNYLEAIALVDATAAAPILAFSSELNATNGRYKLILAQEKGHRKAERGA